MSLLLQALKKAEEDKRRRAALGVTQAAESRSVADEFPALNLLADETITPEPAAEAALNTAALEAGDWAFVPLDVAPIAAEPIFEAQPATAQALANSTDITVAELPPQVAATQSPVFSAEAVEVESSPAVETLASPTPVLSTPATAAGSPSSPPSSPQVLANSLFTKAKNQPRRGLLPWLLLGAGLLLAGMVAWFTWQYRQLTQPIPKVEVRAPIAAVASATVIGGGYVIDGNTEERLHGDTQGNEVLLLADVAPQKTLKPPRQNTAATATPALRATTDGRDLNPPLKFVRQSPHFSAPEPVLLAWQFYQNGDLEQAELFYRKTLLTDARQRDALLGLAAIAQQRGDVTAAQAWYQRLLRANPQDEAAKAALLLLNSAQMPEQEAVQLEQSGKSDPMALGQYFAAQQRWSQAQEQFFLAYTANPNSADAALNLAVSLDHLQQNTLAKTYYHKALQLKPSSNFDRSKVEQRLAELAVPTGTTP